MLNSPKRHDVKPEKQSNEMYNLLQPLDVLAKNPKAFIAFEPLLFSLDLASNTVCLSLSHINTVWVSREGSVSHVGLGPPPLTLVNFEQAGELCACSPACSGILHKKIFLCLPAHGSCTVSPTSSAEGSGGE